MFGYHKPAVLSKKHMAPANLALAAVELLVERRVSWVDVSVKLIQRDHNVAQDCSSGYCANVRGYFTQEGIENPTCAEAEIYIRLYRDGRSPHVEQGGHKVAVDGRGEYRVRWTPAKIEILESWKPVGGTWISSDDRKLLDELPCEPIHSDLYAVRIRTLGHLKAWTRSQLLEATQDSAVVRGAEKILAAYGCTFRSE